MERIAPPRSGGGVRLDRIGLVVEGRPEWKSVCCALDATQGVVAYAAAAGDDVLVVHHTLIWHPVTAVRGEMSRLLRAILAAGMNLYVMHTNFDRVPAGSTIRWRRCWA